MGFAEIVNPIPFLLSNRTFGGASYQLDTDAYDIAIGGYPFLLGTNDQRPYLREVLDSRKEMFDNFSEPGEYSLTDWWLRSQQDWGGGAGLVYQDPDVDARFNLKFKKSAGINIWTPGDLKLLPAPIPVDTAFTSGTKFQLLRAYRSGGVDKAWRLTSALYAYDPVANTETSVDYGDAGLDPLTQSFTSSGDQYYVATTTAIYTGTDDNTGSKLWTFADPSPGEDGAIFIEFAKQRLMMGYANALYEMVPPVGAPPHALPATPVFTHLNENWRWRSMADGPNAIYAAGNDGTSSAIYKFTLETDGAVPVLTSGGTITASFPTGEIVQSLYSYLGTFVGIGTNLGFRVGEIDANGDISYGPLLWNLPSFEQGGYDRFLYVRVEDGIVIDPEYQDDRNPPPDKVITGLYRVDLGQREQEQSTGATRFAYSTDVYAQHTGVDGDVTYNRQLRSFTILSNKFLLGVTGDDNPISSPMFLDYWPTDFEMNRNGAPDYDLIESGWLQTGRVRYNTLEPKLFRYFSVRSPAPLLGEIDVDVINEAGSATRYITYTNLVPPDVDDIPLTGMDTPKTYMSLRFTLHSDPDDPSQGAVMNGWQIKALPAPRRQRQFTFSVLCFDKEQDKTGQTIGYEGYALERIERIERMAQSSSAFLLQDLYNTVGSQVIIQTVQFVQMAPPGNNTSGWGGYITFQVRTVADVI